MVYYLKQKLYRKGKKILANFWHVGGINKKKPKCFFFLVGHNLSASEGSSTIEYTEFTLFAPKLRALCPPTRALYADFALQLGHFMQFLEILRASFPSN